MSRLRICYGPWNRCSAALLLLQKRTFARIESRSTYRLSTEVKWLVFVLMSTHYGRIGRLYRNCSSGSSVRFWRLPHSTYAPKYLSREIHIKAAATASPLYRESNRCNVAASDLIPTVRSTLCKICWRTWMDSCLPLERSATFKNPTGHPLSRPPPSLTRCKFKSDLPSCLAHQNVQIKEHRTMASVAR